MPSYREFTSESDLKRDRECDGCLGSGKFYGRGHVENGVFKGYSGKCYRCNGTGRQNKQDGVRNRNYDNHVRRFTIA